MTADLNVDVDKLLAAAKCGDADAQFALAEQFRSRASLAIDEHQAFVWNL